MSSVIRVQEESYEDESEWEDDYSDPVGEWISRLWIGANVVLGLVTALVATLAILSQQSSAFTASPHPVHWTGTLVALGFWVGSNIVGWMAYMAHEAGRR